ncbi:hypothetical protein EDB80DRAFT_843259 [Ilyonectria destructans]|nr:hypothetical protein EDB80DRAFT_843259 [Ilyonectria destructans]
MDMLADYQNTAFLKVVHGQDYACLCTDEPSYETVFTCLTGSCPIFDSLAFMNFTTMWCGESDSDLPQRHLAMTAVMTCLAATFTISRLVFKLSTRLELGLDDLCVSITAVLLVPSAAVVIYGTIPNGLGRDIWTLDMHQITNFFKFFYVGSVLYLIEATFLKITFICFYLRLFSSPSVQRILWFTLVFTGLWGFTFIMTGIYPCNPISDFWNGWGGQPNGNCLNNAAVAFTNAATSIVLDLWILAIPIWQLRGLQLHWKRKLSVVVMFSAGTFVTIMSALRVPYLARLFSRFNMTRESSHAIYWSTVEMTVGVLCACLPTTRLILVKLVPIFGSEGKFQADQCC